MLANENAADRTITGATLTSNARSQIVPVKTPKSRRDLRGQLRILVFLGKRPSPRIIRPQPIPNANPKGFRYRDYRLIDGSKPMPHGNPALLHCTTSNNPKPPKKQPLCIPISWIIRGIGWIATPPCRLVFLRDFGQSPECSPACDTNNPGQIEPWLSCCYHGSYSRL